VVIICCNRGREISPGERDWITCQACVARNLPGPKPRAIFSVCVTQQLAACESFACSSDAHQPKPAA